MNSQRVSTNLSGQGIVYIGWDFILYICDMNWQYVMMYVFREFDE